MEKQFTKKLGREISEKVQEILATQLGSSDFTFTISGGRFSSDELKLNLVVKMKDEDGSIVVSEHKHFRADTDARSEGLTFEGHLIGSTWSVRGNTYEVVGYETKRPKYPLSLKDADGKRSKSAVGFLKQGYQIIAPTELQFVTWASIDPDDDAVLESDVEIYDKVQQYIDANYPGKDGDDFMEVMTAYYEAGAPKRDVKLAYQLFTTMPLAQATKELWALYNCKYTTPKRTRK